MTIEAPPRPKQKLSKPGDDGDDVAHVFDKDDIMRSLIDGVKIRALCGYEKVLSKEPTGLPVCRKCWSIWQKVRAGSS